MVLKIITIFVKNLIMAKKKEKRIPKTVHPLETTLIRLDKLREKQQPLASLHAYLSYILDNYGV